MGEAAGAEALQEMLWKTFTHYTLKGDPLQPHLMRAYEFTLLAKDCGVLDLNEDLSMAALHVLVAAEASKVVDGPARKAKNKRLTYHAFLNSVLVLAARTFPGMAGEEAMHKFIREKLCLAQRTQVADVKREMGACKAVLGRFRVALEPLFHHYASKSERAGHGKRQNLMKDELQHLGFIKFAKDFGLSSTSNLSTTALGEIFLGSIDHHAFVETIPKLKYHEFESALVRCALRMGSSAPACRTAADKLKSLLLVMWKTGLKRNQFTEMLEQHKSVTVYGGDLMEGTLLLNKRFTEMWEADGHPNYLAAPQKSERDGFDIIYGIFSPS